MVSAGVTRLMDLRAESAPPPYPVPCDYFPLQDLEFGQHAMLSAAARQVKRRVEQGEIVGIYCQAGLSRTAAVACAYLLEEDWSLNDAIRYVSERHPQAAPALGLMRTLEDLARMKQSLGLRHEAIKVGKTAIHAVHVPGPGETMVLLHGAYGSWSHWWNNLGGLRQESDVWLLDLPGFGESSDWDTEAFSWPDYLRVLKAAIEQIAPRCAMLGGYSFGAYLAVYLLAEHPFLAKAALLVSLVGRTGDPARHQPIHEERFLPHFGFADRVAVVRRNLARFHLCDPESVDAQTVYLIYHNIFRTRLSPGTIRASRPRVLPLDLVSRLSIPTLMLWGKNDPFCQPSADSWAEALQTTNPGLYCRVLPGLSHWCQYEDPDRFLTEVRRFSALVTNA